MFTGSSNSGIIKSIKRTEKLKKTFSTNNENNKPVFNSRINSFININMIKDNFKKDISILFS